LGRSKGLRVTMISQRPAKLHKDSLSQAHTLIAMKLIAPQDRKAISEWVSDQTDPEYGKELIASLPSLVPGEGWVWAPAEGVLDRVKFPRPRTYDSSQAPDEGAGDAPVLAKIDPATISGRLATVAAEAEANDPAKLKRRIAELERAKAAPAIDPAAIGEAEQRGFERGHREGLAVGEANARAALTKAISNALSIAVPVVAPASRPNVAKVAPTPVQREAKTPVTPLNGNLTGPQMKVLSALAMWKTLGKNQPTKPMVAMCAGYSHSSGGFGNLLGQLRASGAIEYPSPGTIMLLTDAAAIDADGARDMLLGKLTNPQRKLIDALKAGDLTKAALGEATGYSPTSGGFGNLLGQLRSLGLIDYPQPGRVALEPWVFDLL